MTNPQHLAAADAAELKESRTACPHLDAAARHVHDIAEVTCDWLLRTGWSACGAGELTGVAPQGA
ncbi:hypothetical protein [Streptomyces sp. NPDC093093]|uniref:hypothetical protein n=1 Tax=Streptomyces sp. NPDC093093 TaxID=3366025 RepID=UPI0038061C8B